jgi:putative ABC transport system permease protein
VGLSLLLAVPISAWVMHSWLNKYAYRISLSWRVFTEASGLMAALALATVFFLSVMAARAKSSKQFAIGMKLTSVCKINCRIKIAICWFK